METGIGTEALPPLEAKQIQQLKAQLRGVSIRPGEPAYDSARRVYNGMIDCRPQLIVRPADPADVTYAVNFARENNVPLAIRGGGHSVAGFGTCDGGMVLDLSSMKSLRVDPKKRRVRAEGGCTWGDLDHAAHGFGLATPGGVLSTTGIAGLTLGGGFGYLSRRFGLACDNLTSVDVVTAEGKFLTADARHHPDLFWALRGGGGNFGVVTSFEYKLHPVSQVYAGPILYRPEQARDVLRLFRETMADAPDELSAFFAYMIVPPGPPFPEALHNQKMCGIVSFWSGALRKAQAALRPFRSIPTAFEMVGPMPYPVVQSLFDALLPPGLHHYWKSDFMRDLSDEAIDVHLQYGPRVPSMFSLLHIYSLGGAIGRVSQAETAFHYRDAKFVHIIAGVDPKPEPLAQYREWVREYWSALHPHSMGGSYVNFLGDEGHERIAAAYGGNFDRLIEIKNKYDANNVFCLNQNIRPAA